MPENNEPSGRSASAPALYATSRNYRTVSYGGRVAVVADHLGTPLMPWQRQVADVACEVSADGRWRYPLVVVTVPRQAGKTTLMRAVAVDRALSRPAQTIFTTAQTGKDAAERWKDMVDRIETSPLRSQVKVHRAAGSQQVVLPNRSRVRAFAPTPTSIHGYTPHLVMIDEAWSFDEARGEALIAAINPAQITLPDRQLWIVSTKGDASSAFLDRYLELGRLAVGDPGADVAYFEWAAAEGEAPYDPATLAFHPAVGHTITIDDLLAQADTVSRGVWERSYLNRASVSLETILDIDVWREQAVTLLDPPPAQQVGIGYDVATQDAGAAVWAAWHTPDGRIAIKHLASGPGAAWLTEQLTTGDTSGVIAASGITPCCDDAGPVRQVTDELRRLDRTVNPMSARDYATACSTWLRRARAGELLHEDDPDLNTQLEAAATKPLAGQVAIDPAKSAGPVDHLRAAVAALRALEHAPRSPGKPVILG